MEVVRECLVVNPGKKVRGRSGCRRGCRRARDEFATGGTGSRDIEPPRQHRRGEGYTVGDGDGRGREDDGRVGRGSGNVPFEFVGEVASAGAVAEAGDVERGTTTAGHLAMIVGCLSGVVLRDLQVRQVAVVGELVMMLKAADGKPWRKT